MARSRKKVPIVGISLAKSEKDDKVAAHRRERRIVRAEIPAQPEVLTATKEVSDPWDYSKDGKQYVTANKLGEVESLRWGARVSYLKKLLRK